MQQKILNYRVIVFPDFQTGTKKLGFTAFCPRLGVADDGDTIDEALENVKGAMEAFVLSLVEDKEAIPLDFPEQDILTTAQIGIPSSFKKFSFPSLCQEFQR